MSPLNVGIVGTGIFAKDMHLPCYQAYPDKFRVAAANNRTKSKAENFAKLAEIPENKVYDTVDEIFQDKDIDFVDAMLPVQYNLDIVKKAIAAKKPILLEKPIAANLKQARELVHVAESSNVPVGIAENWLYLEVLEEARKHIGKIGPILAFTHNSTGPFVSSNKYLATTWRQNPEHIGGFLSDGGVHQMGLAASLVGEFETVSALTRQVREQSGTDDIVFSTVSIKNSDVIGTFTYGSAFGATDKSVYLKIYGKNGSLLVDLSDKAHPVVKVRVGGTQETAGSEEVYPVKTDGTAGVKAEFLNFHETVSKKDKHLFKGSPRVTFHHLAVIAAFLDSSAKKGSPVKVEEP